MSRPTPRRPSRTNTPRPRRLAGRRPPATDASATDVPGTDAPPDVDQAGGAPPSEPPMVELAAPDGEPRRERRSLLASARVTRMLIALLGALVLLLVLQTGWFIAHGIRNDDDPPEGGGSGDPIEVDPDRPVVLDELAVQEGVEAAALAAETLAARTHEKYDAEVDEATGLMTERFAKEYRKTADDVRREFIDNETEVQVRVVAQSVVRANRAELEALVYLNQYVIKGQGKKATTTYTPYRALLTMVHTDQGWLVDDLDTE